MTDLANELTNDSNDNVSTTWLASLPDELKASKSLSKFNDVSALASSYLEAEKSLNIRVAIPKEDATPRSGISFILGSDCLKIRDIRINELLKTSHI